MMQKLTDAKCRAARPKDRPYKLADGGGLALAVLPGGGKSWRFAFRFDGKQKQLVIGPYPVVSLSEARKARDDAKRRLAEGVDPAFQKRLDKLTAAVRKASTFGSIADELLAKDEREGKRARTLEKKRYLLGTLAAPLRGRPIAEILAPELLAILRSVEARGRYETAKRLRGACGEVFRYAIATGRAERDPSADLRGALTLAPVQHRAALTDPDEIGALWRAIDSYENAAPETRLALKFAMLTAARPGEVRSAEWSEIMPERRTWVIPAAKMKMGREWRTPLSNQAMALLAELRPLTGYGKFLFPNGRSPLRPMSDGAMIAALRRMGYSKDQLCVHGFRSSFSTLANENGRWSVDVIEAALAHQDNDAVRRAYNRASFWRERTELAQWWADELDRLAGAHKRAQGALKVA